MEVSHFAFIASLVPALFCTTVLVAGYGASAKGREMLFGPSGLLGWTQSPGLALAQIVSSILGGERDRGLLPFSLPREEKSWNFVPSAENGITVESKSRREKKTETFFEEY